MRICSGVYYDFVYFNIKRGNYWHHVRMLNETGKGFQFSYKTILIIRISKPEDISLRLILREVNCEMHNKGKVWIISSSFILLKVPLWNTNLSLRPIIGAKTTVWPLSSGVPCTSPLAAMLRRFAAVPFWKPTLISSHSFQNPSSWCLWCWHFDT